MHPYQPFLLSKTAVFDRWYYRTAAYDIKNKTYHWIFRTASPGLVIFEDKSVYNLNDFCKKFLSVKPIPPFFYVVKDELRLYLPYTSGTPKWIKGAYVSSNTDLKHIELRLAGYYELYEDKNYIIYKNSFCYCKKERQFSFMANIISPKAAKRLFPRFYDIVKETVKCV